MTLEPRFHAFRGQSYGIDLVKLGPFGLRAAGALPAALDRYAIYGEPVYSPCDGTVVTAFDGAPDMTPPQPDRAHMAGNHALIDCAGVHVLVAHFRPGTVRVRAGEQIGTTTLVGLVGNSGNSNEPHLHVHAQRPAADISEPLSGDPLPVRFDARFIARNDRVVAAARSTR